MKCFYCNTEPVLIKSSCLAYVEQEQFRLPILRQYCKCHTNMMDGPIRQQSRMVLYRTSEMIYEYEEKIKCYKSAKTAQSQSN
jgi:hypothetical protein